MPSILTNEEWDQSGYPTPPEIMAEHKRRGLTRCVLCYSADTIAAGFWHVGRESGEVFTYLLCVRCLARPNRQKLIERRIWREYRQGPPASVSRWGPPEPEPEPTAAILVMRAGELLDLAKLPEGATIHIRECSLCSHRVWVSGVSLRTAARAGLKPRLVCHECADAAVARAEGEESA